MSTLSLGVLCDQILLDTNWIKRWRLGTSACASEYLKLDYLFCTIFESHRVLADHGDCFLFKERQVDDIKRVV